MELTDNDLLKLKRLIKNFDGLVLPLKRFRGDIYSDTKPPKEQTLKHGDYFRCAENGLYHYFIGYNRKPHEAEKETYLVYNKILRSYDTEKPERSTETGDSVIDERPNFYTGIIYTDTEDPSTKGSKMLAIAGESGEYIKLRGNPLVKVDKSLLAFDGNVWKAIELVSEKTVTTTVENNYVNIDGGMANSIYSQIESSPISGGNASSF